MLFHGDMARAPRAHVHTSRTPSEAQAGLHGPRGVVRHGPVQPCPGPSNGGREKGDGGGSGGGGGGGRGVTEQEAEAGDRELKELEEGEEGELEGEEEELKGEEE